MDPSNTRNPTGHGENAAILGVFTSIGLWLGSLVDDPNLRSAIVVLTTLVGKFAFTVASNWLGAPIASLVGAGAMKGAQLGVILLALWLPLGCVGYAGPHGVGINVGKSTTKICKGDPQTCTEITGAPVSVPAANVAGGLIAGVLRFFGMSYGVPVVPPTAASEPQAP